MRVSTGDGGRAWLLTLVVVVALGTMAPAFGTVDAASPASEATPDPSSEVGPLQVTTPTTNASNQTHHENPDAVSESGDLTAVRGWLAGRMGETLVDCTESLQNPALEAACERSNEEYPDWLEMYVDTVRETPGEGDDSTADTFGDANEHQQAFRKQVQRFRETRREYEQARESGNTDRARQKARELLRVSRNVERTGDALAGDFRNLSAETDLQLNDSAATVTELTNETTQTAATVRADLFLETNVDVLSSTETVSFLDPLRLRGRLTAENGSVLRNRPVVMEIGATTVRTRTDSTGEFGVAYRPTTLPLDTDQIELTYVPRNETNLLGNSTRVPVDVEQVNATVSTSASPERAAFGDSISVDGTVEAGGVGAAEVPVVVAVDGRVLGRTTTDGDGDYDLQADLPADVSPGTRSLTARVALSGRALAAGGATDTLAVEPTATALSIDGGDAGEGTVRVSGRLTTEDGVTVPRRSVRLVVGEDQRNETVRTDDGGGFAATVRVPRSAFDDGANATVPVTVVFDGDGTNLEASRASTTVRVTNLDAAGSGGGGNGPLQVVTTRLPGDRPFLWILGFVVAGALAAGWYYRDGVDSSAGDASESATRGDDSAGPSGDDESPAAESVQPAPLDAARDRLEDGAFEAAITLAYTAVRERVTTETESASARTHWEFYAACRDGGLDQSRLDDLRELTERYERATFAPVDASGDDAERALDLADRLVESGD